MEISDVQAKQIHDIIREYRVVRDLMTSPLNPERATHIQFIFFCNDRAMQVHRIIPQITFDELMNLYREASHAVPGFRANRIWADYTIDDEVALTELCGVLLGILRQQRT